MSVDVTTSPAIPTPLSPDGHRHRNNFDVIRLVLATLVILSHSSELIDGNRKREVLAGYLHATFSSGELAVNGFFLLSGYLIAQSWTRDPRLFVYLWKRALRIYPGFLVAALVSVFVVGPFSGNPSYWSQFRFADFCRNSITLRFHPPIAFPSLPYPKLNGALWTIPYEFLCYLLIAALGIAGVLRHRWLVAILLLACYTVYVADPWVPSFTSGEGNTEARLISLFRLVTFYLVGTCFYLYRTGIAFTKMGAVGAASVAFAASQMGLTTRLFLPIAEGYVLFALAFSRVRLTTPLPFDASYGMYLYAWPIQSLIILHFPSINPWLLFAVSTVLSYLAGVASWLLVEQRVMLLGRGGPKNHPRTAGSG